MIELSTTLHKEGIFVYNTFTRNSPVTQGTLPPRHTLSVKDAAALEPFYRAQRPHGAVLTWRQLRAAGAKPKPVEPPALKFVCDAFNEAYPNDSNLDYDKYFNKQDPAVSDDSVSD